MATKYDVFVSVAGCEEGYCIILSVTDDTSTGKMDSDCAPTWTVSDSKSEANSKAYSLASQLRLAGAKVKLLQHP